MSFQRAFAVAVTFSASVFLSGCFTVSKNLPAGTGPINDERLVGAWVGVNDDGGIPSDTAFLHFQKIDDDKPLRLVWVEDKGYQVYDLLTRRIGNKTVFAAKLIGPEEAIKEKDMLAGYFIGFYDVKGADDVVFHLLDSEKIGKLIVSGKVKGIKPPGKYDLATLTGSPDELARFLASPDAASALAEEPARLRRVPMPAKK
ncbi:MAG: hypothetical protein ABL996_05785 [Micropepsaceae bacterium]